MSTFKAIVISENDGGYQTELCDLPEARLPEGNVDVEVTYSSINYKDALAFAYKAPIIRRFPMVPGIDLTGRVTRSTDAAFRNGDQVVLNGWGVGEVHPGGFAQRARLRGEWLQPLPRAFSSHDAMVIGSAGVTAALCALALQRSDVMPDDGDILVTGATGGVGSLSILLLSRLGYRVVASTGKLDEADWLKRLGASEVIDRASLASPGSKPLADERWAGVVDALGGHTLVNACAATRYGGTVTACGLAQSMNFPATVAPFILRGITLVGIDSVYCPMPRRREAWALLAKHIDRAALQSVSSDIGLGDVMHRVPAFLQGQVKGRIVVDVNA